MTFSKTAPFLIKLVVSSGLLVWLFMNLETDQLFANIGAGALAILILMSAVIALSSLILGYRWTIILNHMKARLSVGIAAKSVIIGMFFNQFLPSTVGGDVVRVVLAKKHGLSILEATYSIISDRVFGFAGLVILCVFGLPFLTGITNDPVMVYGEALLILIAVGGIAFLFFMHFAPLKLRQLKLLSWLVEIANASAGVVLKSGKGLQVFAISVFVHFLDIAMLYLMTWVMGIDISFAAWLILIPPAILVSSAPISISGWGVREGIMVLVLSKIGVGAEDAIMISLSYGISHALAGAIGGIFWIRDKATVVAD